MKSAQLKGLNLPYSLAAFDAFNLVIESDILKSNPLQDTHQRHNYVLVPKIKGNWPIIFHLCGYFSTAFDNFYFKNLNENFVQKIDHSSFEKRMPLAVHVFVEANTFWGGSQFINSSGCGRYQDYILDELYKAVIENWPIDQKSLKTCLMGGSSGGYGVLSLISQKDSPFNMGFAVAPDSLFEMSLLPEIFQAAPELSKYSNFTSLKKKIKAGEIQEKKSFFNLMNVIAMAHCYSSHECLGEDFIDFPIDLYSGQLKPKVWQHWLQHDPVHFLKDRMINLKNKEIHLDVGTYDNYHLQFGTRQIFEILKSHKIESTLSEFPGQHFGFTARKILFLESLPQKGWSIE